MPVPNAILSEIDRGLDNGERRRPYVHAAFMKE
jgi:hypothetical protein